MNNTEFKTAMNNFYIIQPYERKTDDVADAIYKYENSLNTDAWRGNLQLALGKIVSADYDKWAGSITGCSYAMDELVVFDPTCVIKHFDDGTKLIRDDAIICLFNDEENAPGANTNEVVIKADFSDNIINGFCGTVVDIHIEDYYKERNINNISIGDKIILVNPYKAGSECWADVYKKVSTTNGFYIISEVDAIACKVDFEK